MNAKFVSVWDGGIEVITNCQYNPQTKIASDIESVEINVDNLEEEYIIFNDEYIYDFTIE